MFSDLNVFKAAHAMATHAGQRQSVVARNIANADTPGYKAQDVTPFAQVIGAGDVGTGMRSTRTAHFDWTGAPGMTRTTTVDTAATDPNGNSVSVEVEMMKAVEVSRQHEKALAVYKSSLSLLRTSLGRF